MSADTPPSSCWLCGHALGSDELCLMCDAFRKDVAPRPLEFLGVKLAPALIGLTLRPMKMRWRPVDDREPNEPRPCRQCHAPTEYGVHECGKPPQATPPALQSPNTPHEEP